MTYQRNVLLDSLYSNEHLLWFYRSACDRNPHAFEEEPYKDLIDFTQRAVCVARALLDDDSADRRSRRPFFRPAPPAKTARLFDLLEARRAAAAKADEEKAAARAAPAQPPDSEPHHDGEPPPSSVRPPHEGNASPDQGYWSPPKPRPR